MCFEEGREIACRQGWERRSRKRNEKVQRQMGPEEQDVLWKLHVGKLWEGRLRAEMVGGEAEGWARAGGWG